MEPLKYLLLPLKWIALILSFLCRRDHNISLFGADNRSFSNNSKYKFLEMTGDLRGDQKVFWVTRSKSLAEKNADSGNFVYLYSVNGILLCLRAQFYYYNCYVSDITVWLSGGATKINLWHGMPIKEIEYLISHGPMRIVYNPESKKEKFISALRYLVNPGPRTKPDILLSESQFFVEIMAESFRLPQDKVHVQQSSRVKYLKQQIRTVKPSNRILYLPTFRGAGILSLVKLMVEQLDACLLRRIDIKPHPNDYIYINEIAKIYPNLKFVYNQDVYDLIPKYKNYVTDISSLIFDLELICRPYYIYFPDIYTYSKSNRGFIFNIEELFGVENIRHDFNDIFRDIHESKVCRYERVRRMIE